MTPQNEKKLVAIISFTITAIITMYLYIEYQNVRGLRELLY